MFDPDLLRTFLVVARTLSFTKAALQLGVSQPTVSQHIRRLEDAAGRQLILRNTRVVTLTDNGEAMAGFARTILAANDQAANYFAGTAMKGRLRFGAADDLAQTQVPRILREFRQLYPQINLELTVTQSHLLVKRLRAGHLDLVFVKQIPGEGDGHVVRRDRLVWVGLPGTELKPDGPVPLITYQAPSMSRTLAIKMLEESGRTWRITCNTREVNGILAATRAGIGISVLSRSVIPPDLIELPAALGLPDLGEVEIALVANPLAAKGPVDALTAAIFGQPLRAGVG